MPKQRQSWKNLERQSAKLLGGHRVLRGANFGISDLDVRLDDFPELKIDCKYRASHAHHTLLAEIRKKYCLGPSDIEVLITKHHRQDGAYVTIPIEFFAALIEERRRRIAGPDYLPADVHDDVQEQLRSQLYIDKLGDF